jgi:hypothetical protein
MVQFPEKDKKFFSSLKYPDQLWCMPSLSCSLYQEALSLGVKWPAHDADHSPTSSDTVKNEHSCTSTSTYAFMAFLRTTLPLPLITGHYLSIHTGVWNAFRCTGSIQWGQRTAQDGGKQADSHTSMRQPDTPHIHKILIASDMKTQTCEKIHMGFAGRVWLKAFTLLTDHHVIHPKIEWKTF